MTQEIDPIAEQLLEGMDLPDGEVDFGGPYGVGKWPEATLTEVNTLPRTDERFGFRLEARFNLKGDSMQYTGRLDLPRTVATNGDEAHAARANKANNITRNLATTVFHRAGVYPTGKLLPNIDTQDAYEKFVSLLQLAIGKVVPIEVKVDRRFNKESGKYEDSDFTKFQGLREKKA